MFKWYRRMCLNNTKGRLIPWYADTLAIFLFMFASIISILYDIIYAVFPILIFLIYILVYLIDYLISIHVRFITSNRKDVSNFITSKLFAPVLDRYNDHRVYHIDNDLRFSNSLNFCQFAIPLLTLYYLVLMVISYPVMLIFLGMIGLWIVGLHVIRMVFNVSHKLANHINDSKAHKRN